MKPFAIASVLFLALVSFTATAAEPPKIWQSTEAEDYKIDRKEVFEFTKKPTLERDGDRVTIRFTSKDFCDATIVIERTDGTILRHLVSGVLGPNAPEPFRKNSLEQTVVWDGKDDLGKYIDDLGDVRVRVSLGLKPQFEKALFWHPKKVAAMRRHPQAVAQPEGVYVYDGGGVEQVKLYSHEGQYIRTVYPFPAEKVGQVAGLKWNTFADGHKVPARQGYWHATFLPSGCGFTEATWGTSARAFAVRDGRIAVAPWSRKRGIEGGLARFRTDSTTGDTTLYGPRIDTPFPMQSAALSQDGKWLYLAGPYLNIQPPYQAMFSSTRWRHAVYRMEYAGNEPPKVWLGNNDKPGKGDKEFNHPASVVVDNQGRVYIADNQNDRVQIFSPEGELLKSVPVKGPFVLQLHHKTQELYVFCWTSAMGYGVPGYNVPAVMHVFDPFKSTEAKLRVPIPLWGYSGGNVTSFNYTDEMPYRVALNSYTAPVTFWTITSYRGHRGARSVQQEHFQRYKIENGKFVLLESWNAEVAKSIAKLEPPDCFRQRLLVDPSDGMLYSMEENRCVSGALIRIHPDTDKSSMLGLPFHADDAIFDYEGHLLLRCDRLIGRFSPRERMREVPFDYGEERHAKWDSFSRGGNVRSAIVLPGNRTVNWFESGMGVNPNGEIVVSAYNSAARTQRMLGSHDRPQAIATEAPKYIPAIYPGRLRALEIHVFDRHGKLVASDAAAQGAPVGWATLIDPRGDIYFFVTRNRVYNGKPFHPLTGCVIKFKRGKGRFIAAKGAEVGLNKKLIPTYPQQIDNLWVENAEWIYPGAGFSRNDAPCTCWNSRMSLDVFGRSFIPSHIRNQVAVLDTNGNLILNVGRYGNVDDGLPLVADQRFRTEEPRSVGGDEVALMYANFTATHSDRRLFISDTGNGRILSVKLDYHVNERIPLKNGPDAKLKP